MECIGKQLQAGAWLLTHGVCGSSEMRIVIFPDLARVNFSGKLQQGDVFRDKLPSVASFTRDDEPGICQQCTTTDGAQP